MAGLTVLLLSLLLFSSQMARKVCPRQISIIISSYFVLFQKISIPLPWKLS